MVSTTHHHQRDERMNISIQSCHVGSETAYRLRKALTIREFKHNHPWDLIINWGSTNRITATGARILNQPNFVVDAINKVTTFKKLQKDGINTPPYETLTTTLEPPLLLRLNKKHNSQGIILIQNDTQLKEALESVFLTQYVFHKAEHRIHVFAGQVIATETRPSTTKNHIEEDWDYIPIMTADVPNIIKDAAVDAIKALLLDFGAVDVLELPGPEYCILEVNTAPQLRSPTLEAYVHAIRKTIMRMSP